MAAKLSNFMIGLVLIGLITGGIGIFFGYLNEGYDIEYDESELAPYNNIEGIYNQTKTIEDEATQINPNTNPLQELVSIIDGFFTGAYNTLILAWSSFDIFNTVASESIDDVGAGEFSSLFKIALGVIATLIIVLGVIVSAIVKRDI